MFYSVFRNQAIKVLIASGLSEFPVLKIRTKAINWEIHASNISDFRDMVFLTLEVLIWIKFLIWEIDLSQIVLSLYSSCHLRLSRGMEVLNL